MESQGSNLSAAKTLPNAGNQGGKDGDRGRKKKKEKTTWMPWLLFDIFICGVDSVDEALPVLHPLRLPDRQATGGPLHDSSRWVRLVRAASRLLRRCTLRGQTLHPTCPQEVAPTANQKDPLPSSLSPSLIEERETHVIFCFVGVTTPMLL